MRFENIKIKELKNEPVILIDENSQKLLSTLCHQKKKNFFFCMYEMYVISAEGYKNAKVDFLTVNTAGEIWVSMKDVQSGMGVKNISDLVWKEGITKPCT